MCGLENEGNKNKAFWRDDGGLMGNHPVTRLWIFVQLVDHMKDSKGIFNV